MIGITHQRDRMGNNLKQKIAMIVEGKISGECLI